ncbi:MAG: response regulator receiver protein [Candidatus Magnetoglobus multicellularis str. Araruama]|uniref:Response regulator receiver protein n=1 Tax=Candidatus Magnetoglobus multicellularis str. Araruama TaxID=890399 RepID=A0A1V1P3X8_9BACT|nr:MAG: response regulator receiver protein [Candidatus Magnetoglobus multicellularis str. Araruama]
MSVITISRGSCSHGKEIAEKLSKKLGYECISRDILLEASKLFNIPEVKLKTAIHDSPSILGRFSFGKERYINFIRNAFLEHIQKDNIVYHGLAGQFFVAGVPSIFKVRIISDLKDRVKEEMLRMNINEKEARHLILKDDEERRKWSMHLYGIDTKDASLYDIVLHINKLQIDDAVEILSDIVRRPCFQTTEESKNLIQDSYIASKAQIAIFDTFPTAIVKCKNRKIYVSVESHLSLDEKVSNQIQDILKDIENITNIYVNVIPIDRF